MSLIQTYTYNPATEKVVPKGAVVLDVEPIVSAYDAGKGRWGYVIDGLRHDANDFDKTLKAIADQIEAQTKPPRIDEPGLWGVVDAKRRELDGSTATAEGKWIRVDAMVCPWQHTSGNYTAEWADLIDPTLVREGVES